MAIKNIQTSHLVHDLKNPVNIIETGARALLEKQDRYGALDPKQEKVIMRMLRSALKIKTLVHNMLEVDMASQGITKTTQCTLADILRGALMEVFDVVDPAAAEALEEASDLESFRRVLEANSVFIDATIEDLNQAIRTDQTKVCLILTNLLSNAFKYRETSVHVRCSVNADSINVSVRDDGPGIPETYHKQIFDQYFQCVPADGFPVRGHGLGLAGALALTEALGGHLSLCRGEHGAEFLVEIACGPEQ
ncbi:MAG: HAMP domain-containing histidine kinase [Deltaproteobacteria bacterium]|nr:HAMP domain-containing histidine kinase [Deltaproteobacteria bacterium]